MQSGWGRTPMTWMCERHIQCNPCRNSVRLRPRRSAEHSGVAKGGKLWLFVLVRIPQLLLGQNRRKNCLCILADVPVSRLLQRCSGCVPLTARSEWRPGLHKCSEGLRERCVCADCGEQGLDYDDSSSGDVKNINVVGHTLIGEDTITVDDEQLTHLRYLVIYLDIKVSMKSGIHFFPKEGVPMWRIFLATCLMTDTLKDIVIGCHTREPRRNCNRHENYVSPLMEWIEGTWIMWRSG